jgi:type II secretory pathway pseudopilin PulG
MQIETLAKNENSGTVRSGEYGFSILEVIVAMVIFLGVTASIWGLMQVGIRARTTTNENVQLTKAVRVGLNLIGRDTYNAGLGYPASSSVIVADNKLTTILGIPPDANTAVDKVPPIISGNNITLNTFNLTPGVRTDQVTFLTRDMSFNLIGNPGPPDRRIPQPLTTNFPVPPTSTVVELRSETGSTTAWAVNDLYLVTGGDGNSRLGVATSVPASDRIRFTEGDRLLLNNGTTANSIEGVAGPKPSLKRVQMVTYFVTADGTLTRRRYNNAPPSGWVDEPLIYGVENFQIQYVMNDGSLTDSPTATQAELALIRQIRYTISVRSVENGPNNQPYRETMTATFSTRNMGYEAS